MLIVLCKQVNINLITVITMVTCGRGYMWAWLHVGVAALANSPEDSYTIAVVCFYTGLGKKGGEKSGVARN